MNSHSGIHVSMILVEYITACREHYLAMVLDYCSCCFAPSSYQSSKYPPSYSSFIKVQWYGSYYI